MITFVLGGNKSGKSSLALGLLEKSAQPAVLLATGRARDLSFRRQILSHREQRNPAIPVIEVGPDLPARMIQARSEYASVLVDSLDFWLFACCEEACDQEMVCAFLDSLQGWDGKHLLLVSSEIGLGPLPASREARNFVRELGALNQKMAALAGEVVFTVSGLPITLKKA